MAIWYFVQFRYISWPFGIFCSQFGVFFLILVCCTKKNLATLHNFPPNNDVAYLLSRKTFYPGENEKWSEIDPRPFSRSKTWVIPWFILRRHFLPKKLLTKNHHAKMCSFKLIPMLFVFEDMPDYHKWKNDYLHSQRLEVSMHLKTFSASCLSLNVKWKKISFLFFNVQIYIEITYNIPSISFAVVPYILLNFDLRTHMRCVYFASVQSFNLFSNLTQLWSHWTYVI
jgi:hypothetical protein